MPVKKGITKKTNPEKKKRSTGNEKRVAAKKISREERESIKKAVSSLSGLLVEHAPVQKFEKETAERRSLGSNQQENWSVHKEEKKIEAKKIRSYSPPTDLEKKKRLIVHVAVGVIMVFIATLWVMNMRSKFSDAGFHLGSEESLWRAAKDDFNNIVKQPREAKEQLKEALKETEKSQETENIKKVLAENLLLLAHSTSTTSTAQTPTSTFETFTSTSTALTPITPTSTLE